MNNISIALKNFDISSDLNANIEDKNTIKNLKIFLIPHIYKNGEYILFIK